MNTNGIVYETNIYLPTDCGCLTDSDKNGFSKSNSCQIIIDSIIYIYTDTYITSCCMKSNLTGAMVFVKFRPGNATPIRPNKWSEETTVIHYTQHPSMSVPLGNSKKIIYREFFGLGEKLFLKACLLFVVFFWKTVLSTVYIIIWYNIQN